MKMSKLREKLLYDEIYKKGKIERLGNIKFSEPTMGDQISSTAGVKLNTPNTLCFLL
jgi:hypothetical protein